MLRIFYEGYIYGPTAKFWHGFYAVGETPAELAADRERKIAGIGLREVVAVGLHNNVADWIAVIGQPDPRANFKDYRPAEASIVLPPPMTRWQSVRRWWRNLRGAERPANLSSAPDAQETTATRAEGKK